MSMIYWIYFDKKGRPEKIVASDVLEFTNMIKQLISENQELPEWICRAYK